ncbi:hypothetical protein PNK_0293 [Candidatus Protochlamydia naegleriophila]|uniref:Uncharacterized protein n=1 Tax=Candidatus Protochlamydia naegleriophila TaxID=389348 RepID=A0A0U5JAU0_9BACT|nr:hypothetical protein [Candidatus Protochlamydia naegleriophila]CUI15930.1 hypothetical protein PNK_0293 [Candidatus Protochlamydia naegleriophila]
MGLSFPLHVPVFQFPGREVIESTVQNTLQSLLPSRTEENQRVLEIAEKTQQVIAQMIGVKLENKALDERQFNRVFSSLYTEVINSASAAMNSQGISDVVTEKAERLLAIPSSEFDASELHLSLILTQTLAQGIIRGSYYQQIIGIAQATCTAWKKA